MAPSGLPSTDGSPPRVLDRQLGLARWSPPSSVSFWNPPPLVDTCRYHLPPFTSYKSHASLRFQVSSFSSSSLSIVDTPKKKKKKKDKKVIYLFSLFSVFFFLKKRTKMNAGDLQLPPGFRFHPTDEELVMHYLCRKCTGMPISVPIVAEIDLYKYDPWDLPGLAVYGEKEWYFFSPRDRKYPNGSRPNRAAGSGYWKATGADKPIGSPKPVGIKKALVFYSGKAPKGEKSNWIMHEYRLADVDRSVRRKNSLRLDDWVLCRIYNKKGVGEKQANVDRKPAGPKTVGPEMTGSVEQKPIIAPQVMGGPTVPYLPQPVSDLLYLDPAESLPRLHADSSCSEHVLSSPEFTCEREVESQLRWRNEWEKALDVPLNHGNATVNGFPNFEPALKDPFQDFFMYFPKPF